MSPEADIAREERRAWLAIDPEAADRLGGKVVSRVHENRKALPSSGFGHKSHRADLRICPEKLKESLQKQELRSQ